MPAHLRVSVADRPGSLAALTRALAAAGANVISLTVLQREGGRAVDDLLLEWPFDRPWDQVVRAVAGCQGARLHGLRHVATAERTPDLAVVQQVVAQPARALEIVVDQLPSLLIADWAAVEDRRSPREPVLATTGAPLPLPAIPVTLPRPRVLVFEDASIIAVPCAHTDLRLLVGREGGPGFTRGEREHAAQLFATVVAVAETAYLPAATVAPNELTAAVLTRTEAYIG